MLDNLKDREKKIVQLLADNPLLTVNDIAGELGVSVVTARSDLDAVADKGYLLRVRGGALPAFHPDIVVRQQSRTEEKRRIAQAAAEMVRDGDSVMIESGTTTALIARFLLGTKDLKVVTDSTLILPYARANPMMTVVITGGVFRSATEAMGGPSTIAELSQYHARLAFLGADGISAGYGITTNFVEAAEVSRTMAAHSETTVLLADSSKFGRYGFTRVMALTEIDILITDSGISPETEREIREQGVSVLVV